MTNLMTNASTRMLSSISNLHPFLQIESIDSIQPYSSTTIKYRVQISNGLHSHHTLLPIEYNIFVMEDALKKGSVVHMQEYTFKKYTNFMYILTFLKFAFIICIHLHFLA